jgi:DUF4097 and DUF4098 domain-containing protein YvlB
MTTWNFPCSEPVDISIDSWGSGSIAVSGEPTSSIAVEVLPSHNGADVDDLLSEVRVSFEDAQLYVHGPRHGSFRRKKGLDLTIKVPAGSSCAAKTTSADVSCVGDISALAVQTASGDVVAAAVSGDVTVQCASGDVLLDKAGGNLTVHTASGDLRARQVDGEARINSASGDVAIGSCSGSVSAHTASGDINLGGVAAGRVQLNSSSGDMEVAVVPGIGVYLDLASTSGSIRSELDEDDGDAAGAAVEIKCRTLSGDIRIRKAQVGADQASQPE